MRFRYAAIFVSATAALGSVGLGGAPTAGADAVAYLVNVTVRPGYNFPNAEAALAYGGSFCGDIASGNPYRQVMQRVKADFNTHDEYQASYLISQSANELCPAQIWQLRRSAAGYTPTG